VLEILGSGHSSVGGSSWYLVGQDHEVAFWVVRQLDAAPRDPTAYEVRRFVPSNSFEKCPTVSDAEASSLISFVGEQVPRGDLNWTDAKRARDLFWEYKGATGRGA
jgi:hypothetical protein